MRTAITKCLKKNVEESVAIYTKYSGCYRSVADSEENMVYSTQFFN